MELRRRRYVVGAIAALGAAATAITLSTVPYEEPIATLPVARADASGRHTLSPEELQDLLDDGSNGSRADASRSPSQAAPSAPAGALPTTQVRPVPVLSGGTAEDTDVMTRPKVIQRERGLPDVSNIAGGRLLSQPVRGRASSPFGMRFHPVLHRWKLHTGQDWAIGCGTPVGAAAPGIVVKAGWAGGNGVQVKVDHGELAGHHVVTTYNHLSAIGVQVGDRVRTHQGIGRVGSTGYSTGCHLHFEVIADGQFTDPIPWLNGQPVIVDVEGMQGHRPVPTPARPSPTVRPRPPAAPARPTTTAPLHTVKPTPRPTRTPSPTPPPTVRPTSSPSTSPSPTVKPSPSVSPSATDSSSPSPSLTDEPTAEPLPSPTATGPSGLEPSEASPTG